MSHNKGLRKARIVAENEGMHVPELLFELLENILSGTISKEQFVKEMSEFGYRK